MKTITAKTADMTAAAESIYNNIYTEAGAKEAAKVRKLAATMETGFETALQAMLVKKINYGAIKIGKFWYPVLNGEISSSGHTFSNGALNEARHYAGQQGVNLKF